MLTYEEPNGLLTIGENISIFAITGGPCSGKTTGLARLMNMLSDRGYKVLLSPESATKLIAGGMTPGELPWPEFQEEILLDIISQEDRFISIARRYRDKGRKVVILCDRGTMDGEAYVGPDEFEKILRRFGYTARQLCDGRYHAVIHLRTAALGAEQFYTLANNTARYENDLEVARKLDERTLQAWARHQHPRVVDNSTDFEGKLRRLFAEVCGVLGDPIPLEQEEKFTITQLYPASLPVTWFGSDIVQDYLLSPDSSTERRVRARSDNDGTSYYYTIKSHVEPGVRLERERMISGREYLTLLSLRDPNFATIHKKRICFFWKEQFFEVDLFSKPYPLAVMEIEQTDRLTKIEIPPFISVEKKVTGDASYSNRELARLK